MIDNLKIKNRSGQTAIIVMLVSAVMLTLGLSLSKTSTTETKIDTNEELLKKAFNAAESGIDYYLKTGQTNYSSPDGISSAEVSVNNISGDSEDLDFGEYTTRNGSEFYWLVNHQADGSLGTDYYSGGSVSVCGRGFTGSIAVDYFYWNGSNYGVRRSGYNFSSVGTETINGFTNSAGSSCVSITTDNSPLLLAVTPLINGGNFYLVAGPGASFPVQGTEIISAGYAGGSGAEVKSSAEASTRIGVNRRYRVPAFMLFGVSSEDSILSD